MIRLTLALTAACAVLALSPAVQAAESGSGGTELSRQDTPGLDPARQKALYFGVIESLRKDGRAHAALAHLDAYDQQYPRDARAQILRADCLADIADYAGAEAIYRKMLTSALADQAEAGLGHVYAQKADWTQAADAFGRAVKKKPAYAPYINDLGFALVKAGKVDDGLFRLRQAAELAPDDLMIRHNLILAMSEAGHAVEASEMIQAITAPDERRQVQTMLAAAKTDPTPPKP